MNRTLPSVTASLYTTHALFLLEPLFDDYLVLTTTNPRPVPTPTFALLTSRICTYSSCLARLFITDYTLLSMNIINTLYSRTTFRDSDQYSMYYVTLYHRLICVRLLYKLVF